MPLKDKKYNNEFKERKTKTDEEKRLSHLASSKKYSKKNKEKICAKEKMRYAKHPEKGKIKREKNKEKYRDNKLKKTYGINVAEYDERLKEQGEKCAICGKKVNKRKNKIINFNVDHDHETKEIRGLLCFECNIALQLFEENLKLDKNFIQKVKNYLLEIK